ncbi:MAG: substrate-binding domain-containing protein, partial [Stellaceae bacterium]
MAAAAALLVAVSTGAAADPHGKKIAHLTLSVQQEYIAALVKTINDDSKKYGMEVTTFANNFDPALQAQQMDDAIASKFDMVIIEAASEQAIVPAATRAHAAGMPML